jgi:hypothetical protein
MGGQGRTVKIRVINLDGDVVKPRLEPKPKDEEVLH